MRTRELLPVARNQSPSDEAPRRDRPDRRERRAVEDDRGTDRWEADDERRHAPRRHARSARDGSPPQVEADASSGDRGGRIEDDSRTQRRSHARRRRRAHDLRDAPAERSLALRGPRSPRGDRRPHVTRTESPLQSDDEGSMRRAQYSEENGRWRRTPAYSRQSEEIDDAELAQLREEIDALRMYDPYAAERMMRRRDC